MEGYRARPLPWRWADLRSQAPPRRYSASPRCTPVARSWCPDRGRPLPHRTAPAMRLSRRQARAACCCVVWSQTDHLEPRQVISGLSTRRTRSGACAALTQDRTRRGLPPGVGRLASTATPTATRSGCWARTPDIRSPWRPDTWRPDTWRPDTWRARNWDIDIEVDIDDIRDPDRQPRIDVHGRRWRKFAYDPLEVPVHARRARRWWLGAADGW